MELKLARHLWGVNLSWEAAFPKFREEGYSIIETHLVGDTDVERFANLRKTNDFGYIAMAFTVGNGFKEHLTSFREQVNQAVKLGASQVTAHTGRDEWSASDIDAFYREAVAIEKDLPIPVGHETHRGRAFYNPWVTREVLEKYESLKLCCDFSHWVCVAERLVWDKPDGSILKLCADRAIHTHARVGYEGGPQVPDPTAPEYARHVDQHLEWWDAIFASQKKRGMAVATVTPEFGPPGYMHTLPHTNMPVADLWKVCNAIADRVKTRFNAPK